LNSLQEIESPLFGILLDEFDNIIEQVALLTEAKWLDGKEIVQIFLGHAVFV
jgi:hypothetical protein